MIVGAIWATFASGLGWPRSMDAGPSDLFVLQPFNFYSICNPLAHSEWVVLNCIYSRYRESNATNDHTATRSNSSSRSIFDGAEDKANRTEEVPAKQRRLCR